jgi:serine/threonine protein kinase
LNPEISPQLQEIIYRAIEREPRNRYSSALELAHDLQHQDQVGLSDRQELHDYKSRRSPIARSIAFYAIVALIPVVIFVILFYVARHT